MPRIVVADGYRVRSAIASYIHLHFLSCPKFAERFVQSCAEWRARNRKSLFILFFSHDRRSKRAGLDGPRNRFP
jgi:hypothetical protein